jgi:NAD(P)H-dependent FMN reductase
MLTILISTNRPDSTTSKFAQWYSQLLAQKNIVHQIVSLEELPHDFIFSALYDHQNKNEQFNSIKAKINASTHFIFIIPEYNGSYPGVLKAFVDGMDFPQSFKNKKAALTGISSGPMGGALALSHFTDVLNYVGVHVMPIKPRVARIEKIFIDRQLNDTFLSQLIDEQIIQLTQV